MSKVANTFSCSCCNKAVAKPRFIGGKPFGPSCYKKRMGASAKPSKALFVKAERISVDTSDYLPKATYKIEGIDTTFTKTAPMPINAYAARGESFEDDLPEGAMMVIGHDGKQCFKSLLVSLSDNTITFYPKFGDQITIQL